MNERQDAEKRILPIAATDSEDPASDVDGLGQNTGMAESGELSIDDLGRAYAELMGGGDDPYEPRHADTELAGFQELVDAATESEQGDEIPVTPRGIVESMLFVGQEGNLGLSARRIASFMRGVCPAEIDEIVSELNDDYRRDSSPYEIVGSDDGYRMVLRSSFHEVRDRFYGKIREARLSQGAVDVLAILAYRQPLTRQEIDDLRGHDSGSVLRQLVGRGLLSIDAADDSPGQRCYRTTDRFLALFDLEDLDDLPKSEDPDRWSG